MPSAARNIAIEVCSSSSAVFLGALLLPVAAAPVRLLFVQHLLLFPPASLCLVSPCASFPRRRSCSACHLGAPGRVSALPIHCLHLPVCATIALLLCFLPSSLSGLSLYLSPLPSPDVCILPSRLRSLSVSFLPYACSCPLLIAHVACLCVYLLYCHPPPSHILLCPPCQIRSRRSRGVSPVTPPGERVPLTSVIIPVGSVFVRKAGSSALECYLVRLPGSDEDQGTLRVGLADASGHTEGTYASVAKGGHFSIPCSFEDLPPWAECALRHLLDSPPPFGRAHPRVSSKPPLSTWSSSPLAPLAPLMVTPVEDLHATLRSLSCGFVSSFSLPSFSDLLSPLPADSHPGSRRSLLPSHRELTLLRVWRVPRLASPAFVIFGHLEDGVRRWLHRLHPTASPATFRRLLESTAPPYSVLEAFLLDARYFCPTLSASRSGHPIRLCDMSFFLLRYLWILFGFPLSDPLYSVLRFSFTAPQVRFSQPLFSF